jgi:hypothetical protein
VAATALAVYSASGADPASIQGVTDCQNALGANNAPGGRRQINWDGMPAANSAPSNLPPGFFNVNVLRGATFPQPGTGVQVSGDPPEFGNLNPTDPASFQTFSPPKLFTGIGSNVVETHFFVVGTSTPAVSAGFGAVFTDVDLPFSTKIEFIDSRGKSLGIFNVPAGPDGGLSFLCVTGFKIQSSGRGAPNIVKITSGNVAPRLGWRSMAGIDVVAMDDFTLRRPKPLTPETRLVNGTSG